MRRGIKPHGHKLCFEPGGFVYNGVRVGLTGKPLLALEALAAARGNALTLRELRARCWGRDSDSGEEAVRSAVKAAEAVGQPPDAPCELADVIWFNPGTCPNCRSRGAVTDDDITSGLAPG